MNTLNRRCFFSKCGAGAASLLGMNLLGGKALAADKILVDYPRNGFAQGELQVLLQAMRHILHNITTPNVRRGINRYAKNSLVDGTYSDKIGLPRRSDWSFACMDYQLAYYLPHNFPRVYLEPYYKRDNYWAHAPVGVVQTQNITQKSGQIAGQFHVHVNRYWFTQRAGADPVNWAGLLAHEMMHNLGHLHGKDEYGNHLQVNAIQVALMSALRPNLILGESGELSDSNDDDLIPSGSCGC